jgi:hypothetical protein
MRVVSNRNSVHRGEVSVLAVIQMIIAAGFFLVGWYAGTTRYVVIEVRSHHFCCYGRGLLHGTRRS